jgi:hypothetical protein
MNLTIKSILSHIMIINKEAFNHSQFIVSLKYYLNSILLIIIFISLFLIFLSLNGRITLCYLIIILYLY